MKRILALFMTLMVMGMMAGSLVSAATVSAPETPVSVEWLKINGDEIDPADDKVSFEEGETLEISVKLLNSELVWVEDETDPTDGEWVETAEDADDLEVEVELKDYDKEDIVDSVDHVDLKSGNTKTVNLELTLPNDLGNELGDDTFVLKLRVRHSGFEDLIEYYQFNLEQTDYALKIKDVDFTPGTTVQAGHTLLTKVALKNVGEESLEDVKVVVEIPELGVRASDFMEDIGSGDKARTDEEEDELYLKIPVCAAAGDYTVKVSVEYDGGVFSEEHTLTVLANDACPAPAGDDADGTATGGKLVLTVGPDSQNVVVGKQAVYPLALTNAGKTAKTYVLELSADAWGTAKMSDNLVVLSPGESKVVYAYVTPGDGAVMGQNTATLTLKSDGTVLKTLSLTANVVGKEKSVNLRNGLEIALIVLVVVLVVIGLILGFSRLRKDRDEDDFDDEEGKNYY